MQDIITSSCGATSPSWSDYVNAGRLKGAQQPVYLLELEACRLS